MRTSTENAGTGAVDGLTSPTLAELEAKVSRLNAELALLVARSGSSPNHSPKEAVPARDKRSTRRKLMTRLAAGAVGAAVAGVYGAGRARTASAEFIGTSVGPSNVQSGIYAWPNGVAPIAATGTAGVWGQRDNGAPNPAFGHAGVIGISNQFAGVSGESNQYYGVTGVTSGALRAGVYGQSTINSSSPGVSGLGVGIGVHGKSDNGHGVLGESQLVGVKGQATGNGVGVVGTAVNNFGIYGASTNYVGLWGESQTQVGLTALTNGANQPALYILNTNSGAAKFGALIDGNVFISGNLQVAGGNKNAVVPHPDGSLRALYCQESPEAWFEDFGRAQLVGGVARVNIDPDFAALVLRTGYYVFLTPEGNCNGLYVSHQDANGFEVRELNGGTHSLPFAHRIVAKRKDVASPRLAKVDPKLAARPARVAAAMAAQSAGNNPATGPSLPPSQRDSQTPGGSVVDGPRPR